MITRIAILCLARSFKHNGTCIAGKMVGPGGEIGNWIRPISMRPGHEISALEERLDSNSVIKLLDIVRIPLQENGNQGFQEENRYISVGKWEGVRKASFEEAFAVRDAPATLWENGDHTYNGINDCVHAGFLEHARPTLHLIQPSDTIFHVTRNHFNGNKEVRLSFAYNGVTYKLKVSDIVAKLELSSKECGEYPLQERSLLCISLTEVFVEQAKAYKVVAGVIR